MKILGMGGIEFIIILVVVLLIFGPKNLPKLGSALGKTMSNLRSGMNEGKKKKEEEDAAKAAEESGDAGEPPATAAPAALVGEVEEAVDAAEADFAEVETAVDGAVIDEAADAVSAAEAAVDDEFESKRVKRVVRKKAPTE